jgi:hypothetical protein
MTTIITRLNLPPTKGREDLHGESARAFDLTRAVRDALRAVDWSQPNDQGWTGRYKTIRTEMMLAALTYCYAAGIYDCQEIEEQIFRAQLECRAGHPQLFDLVVTACMLKNFRRHNRDLVGRCLSEVLARRAKETNGGALSFEHAVGLANTIIDRAVEWDCIMADK